MTPPPAAGDTPENLLRRQAVQPDGLRPSATGGGVKVTIAELVTATQGRLIQDSSQAKGGPGPLGLLTSEGRTRSLRDQVLDGISIDSRTLASGNLFVAIRGKRYDGHTFLPEAVRKGAKALLVERLPEPIPSVAVIQVADTQKALGDLARFHRGRFSPHLIAVTGSNGKTTTKELIAHILSSQAPTLKNEGTQNNLIGLPLTLFRLNSSHAFCVLELGMSRKGEIKRLAEICQPTAGVLLNIGPAHLEFLETLEGVFQSKMELVPFLPEKAPLILNAADRFLSNVHLPHLCCVRFGRGGDFLADQIQLTEQGLRFRLNGKDPVFVPLFGLHHVENCLAALATVVSLGVNLQQALQRLGTFRAPSGRMEVRRRGGITFIHDAYNANPISVSKALESFQLLPVGGRRIFVLGDMLELGEEAPRYHEEVGEEALRCGVDILLNLGPLSVHTFSRAKTLGLHRSSHFQNHQELAEQLRGMLREGDWVLVKGSRGMQMERILEALETDVVTFSF